MDILTRSSKLILMLALFTLTWTACTKDDDDEPTQDEIIAQLLDEVRAATSAYHNIDAAINAGWAVDLSGCVEHPVHGGMGHHYARLEYIDGRVNHLEPQVLLYAMDANHQMQFLGVEYIVPFDIVPDDGTPPNLFFHDFHANHHLGIWALHVWTEKDNPNGIFEDWNPTVNCDNWIGFLLNEVRTQTAAFHDFDAAMSAGWNNPLSDCVEHPTEGGMGYHYGRMEFFDGRVNHLEPQVLLYNKDQNDEWEFLGVEYIVPFTIHPADADPPMLFNQHFHPNPNLDIWALHVWTEKDNPNGIFYDWNPNVTCD